MGKELMKIDNRDAEICVVGRCDFSTGIGTMTFAMCELLTRSYPVCLLPTEQHRRDDQFVYLPNGRPIPVCRNPEAMRVSVFVDVLWNGAADRNYLLMPQQGLRYASLMFDSDRLPEQWVDILNMRFDAVIAPTGYCTELLERSGVEIPSIQLPLGLDLGLALSRPMRTPGEKFRFGSIAAFHPRKDPGVLLRAFLRLYGGREDVELLLHSNLAFGTTYEEMLRIVADDGAKNVTISNAALSVAEKDALLDRIDVFVSCSRGEGYSIGPREALARGKVVVTSDVGGHRDLAGTPGVFLIPTARRLPARYPEIDNLVFGHQFACDIDDVQQSLATAFEFARSQEGAGTASLRRRLGSQFSFDKLAPDHARLVNADHTLFRKARPVLPLVRFPAPALEKIRESLGSRAERLHHVSRRVILPHDGGFYSVFNSFLSHLAWDLGELRCQQVLPDWNVRRLMSDTGARSFSSWCYAGLDEGNAWTKLFEPLFGLSDAEMDDPDVLYRNACRPEHIYNEKREPLLTYKHAYKLYQSPNFRAWRRQYNGVWRDHVALKPGFAAEIEAARKALLDVPVVIGAHVRHPSHAMEQPTAQIAYGEHYIDAVRREVAVRGVQPGSNDWRVFLATDQERVVRQFTSAFGSRVFCFADVKRTTFEEDARYEALSVDMKAKEGHQIQHLVAATPERWSSRMAWEIIRDASMLSSCHALLHVTSNVSTAVAYMNPDIELVYCN